MKYWIIIDGEQRGPLSVEEIASLPGLNAATPVWYEGLGDWTTAAAVPEIAALLSNYTANPNMGASGFNPNAGSWQQQQQQSYGQQTYNANPYGYNANPYGGYNQGYDPNQIPQMPSNYLIWAILATICCCIPSGIVAIFYAAKVSPAYYRGDYAAAFDASSKAQLWVIISFVAGLIWAPFSVLFSALL
ncbi:MAG: CD225/dispanin family protein [Staphylococcus sp.]|nr:CD225/dispanin family protein [Staphylococcus sp.]